MSAKDTAINLGLLAAGGVAIAAASGVYGKGSRAKHRSSQDVYRQGRMQALDPNEWPAIPNMQGPFRYASGEVLYYDPREGKYYDRRRDMYVSGPSRGSRAKTTAAGLIERIKQIPGVSSAHISDTWNDGYRQITVVLKTQGTIPVTVEARGAHRNLYQITDYAKVAAAVRAAAKASGLHVEAVGGLKKVYEYLDPRYSRRGDKRESGFTDNRMIVEVYEAKGSAAKTSQHPAAHHLANLADPLRERLTAARLQRISSAISTHADDTSLIEDVENLVKSLKKIPGVKSANFYKSKEGLYITVVLKHKSTRTVKIHANISRMLYQIPDYPKIIAAVRAAVKASGLNVGEFGLKKLYEYRGKNDKPSSAEKKSGFHRDMFIIEVKEGRGSMTRDGSYEATLMFDADEDDPAEIARRALQSNPFVPQSRPMTAEPQRITSAQGSAARGSRIEVSVEQDSLSGLWSVYLHDGRRIVNVTGDVFTTKAAAEREAKAMLTQAKAGVAIDALGSMFWEKHHKPFLSNGGAGSAARTSSVLRGMTAKAGYPIPGPSLKTLDDRLNLGGEEGKSLKYFMQAGQRKAALDYADELLGGNGIEYIASEQDTMRSREGIEYVNMGDTYDTTLIYDYKTGRFYVGAWGDWVERYPKRFGY